LSNVVLDPILRSSSGAELLDSEGLEVLRNNLLPLATVVTPNIEEAAALTGTQVESLDQMRLAAPRLHAMGARNVVITGGHLPSPADLLSTDSGLSMHEFPGKRIDSSASHGTGCAFATALACNLALGTTLVDAVPNSGAYVREAIAAAYVVGHGRGPLHHLHAFDLRRL